MKTWSGLAAATIAAAFGLAGCGGSGPALVGVNGVVTENGKPLGGAAVAFLPDPSHKAGRPAEDLTGPEGNYKAMTAGRSGVVPGKYRVVVTKLPPASAAAATPEAFKDDPFMAGMNNAPRGKGQPAGPVEYNFDRDVPPEGGVLDFDLKVKAGGESPPVPR